MEETYMMFGFTSLFLAGTSLYYRYTKRKNLPFRYKPFLLLMIIILFLVSLYGIITGKPFSEVLPFIR